jgi:hypothetical protein
MLFMLLLVQKIVEQAKSYKTKSYKNKILAAE